MKRNKIADKILVKQIEDEGNFRFNDLIGYTNKLVKVKVR